MSDQTPSLPQTPEILDPRVHGDDGLLPAVTPSFPRTRESISHRPSRPEPVIPGPDQWDGRPHLGGIVMCQSGGVYQPT